MGREYYPFAKMLGLETSVHELKRAWRRHYCSGLEPMVESAVYWETESVTAEAPQWLRLARSLLEVKNKSSTVEQLGAVLSMTGERRRELCHSVRKQLEVEHQKKVRLELLYP